MRGILYFIEPLAEHRQGLVPLEGKYLLRALHQQIETRGNVQTDEAVLFKCFVGTQREVFLLWVSETQAAPFSTARAWSVPQTVPEEAGRFTWEQQSASQSWLAVSQFLRGSTTLPEAALEVQDALDLVVDAKGAAVFCVHPPGDRGTRLLTAYVLALAYLHVLEQCGDELAELTRTSDAQRRAGTLPEGDSRIQALHRTYCTFLASSYFDEPVRKVSTEVGPVYASYRRVLQLDGWRDDLSDRMHRTAELLASEHDRRLLDLERQKGDLDRQQAALDRQKTDQDRAKHELDRQKADQERDRAASERRGQQILGLVALLVALLGLLQVAQTTPVQVGTFYQSWKRCFTEGAGACFNEPAKVQDPAPVGELPGGNAAKSDAKAGKARAPAPVASH